MNLKMPIAGTLGELMRQIEDMIARINLIWGREHTSDGKHLIPEWHTVTDISTATFPAVSNQTWTAQQVVTFEYWKHGNGMTVDIEIVSSTIGGTPADHISILIPDGLRAAKLMRNWVELSDAGTLVDAVILVTANSRTIDIYKTSGAVMTAGTLAVFGQLQFKTTT